MAKKKQQEIDFSQIAAEVVDVTVKDFIDDLYLPYAYYVIYNRALISDDGLKPVNRRVLYTMYDMGIHPSKPYVKAASIAGNTMSKYHPHGNISIEDALARMAQSFAMRVPLIDPYGDVGQVTGDTAAAARYWEARLTPAAVELLKEVKHKASEMTKNYDGTLDEPVLLPIRWPNGIINGSQGIAVGYACEIFPHNPDEIMRAAIALLRNPDLTIDELIEIVPGPDFPTGGTLIGHEGVRQYFETGKGSFSVRGKYTINPAKRGTHEVIFTELPFQMSPEQIIKGVKDAKRKGKLKGVSEIKDLSDLHSGLRLMIKIKAGANPTAVMRELAKNRLIEKRFSANMTVLHEGIPQQLGMIDLLNQFLEFRKQCTANKLITRKEELEKNIKRLSGLISVMVDIDKAISIIRKSDTAAVASEKLQKAFKIDSEQAEYVLQMTLRRLTKSDKLALENEIKSSNEELAEINDTLTVEELFLAYMEKELEATLNVISDPRRTIINTKSAEEIAQDETEEKKKITQSTKNSDCYVTLFANGTVTRTSEPFAQSRALLPILSTVKTKTQDTLYAVMSDGSAQKFPVNYVTENIISGLDVLGLKSRDIVGFGKCEYDRTDVGLLIVTSNGEVNIINGKIPNANEFTAVKVADNQIIAALPIQKSDLNNFILLVSAEGYASYFKTDEIRTSNTGAGTVRGMTTDSDVIGASIVKKDDQVVSVSHASVKVTELNDIPVRKRGAKGVILHKLKDKDVLINAFGAETVVAYKSDRAIRLPEANSRALGGEEREGANIVLGAK